MLPIIPPSTSRERLMMIVPLKMIVPTPDEVELEGLTRTTYPQDFAWTILGRTLYYYGVIFVSLLMIRFFVVPNSQYQKFATWKILDRTLCSRKTKTTRIWLVSVTSRRTLTAGREVFIE